MSLRSNKYKDIERYRVVRERWKRGYRSRTGSNQYGKERWDIEDIIKVMKHEKSDRELSKEIRRSVTAIQICRNRNKEKVDIIELM